MADLGASWQFKVRPIIIFNQSVSKCAVTIIYPQIGVFYSIMGAPPPPPPQKKKNLATLCFLVVSAKLFLFFDTVPRVTVIPKPLHKNYFKHDRATLICVVDVSSFGNRLFGWFLSVFVSNTSITGWIPRQFYVLPQQAERGDHDFCLRQSHFTDPTQIVRSGRPKRSSNPQPPDQDFMKCLGTNL